jgi:CheY-like chemotaxis protein
LRPGVYLKLTVSDTGAGIPDDIVGPIFDPYFTTKPKGEGTGLGLATVHGIVKNHSGEIRVASPPGRGADFVVYFPVTTKTTEDLPYEIQALPTGTEQVLLVDDELAIARMASQVLTRLGYVVTFRTSSIEALELFKARAHDFDLIITDTTMPNMTGEKLAQAILAVRPDMPIILCTGYSKTMTPEAAEEIGIKAFVYKPIIKADLARTIRNVLDSND